MTAAVDDTAAPGATARPPVVGMLPATMRFMALGAVVTGGIFTLNNYLNFWRDWPGIPPLFKHFGWFGMAPLNTQLSADAVTLGWLQLALYLIPLVGLAFWITRTPTRSLHMDSVVLSDLATYLIRACFWMVLLVGLADALISFLRVENMLAAVVGEQLTEDLGRSSYRGAYVHYPLFALSFIIALFNRSLGFTWLALLIVVAEILIVIARFIFSYEQAFMADLVRFWYGALFLFASAYTLMEEGHVRVDILYTSFSNRGKAWANTLGSLFLGMPLCWIILTLGMWDKSNVINGPLLSYEVTQAGYGMYVKWLLAGFLFVFAFSMMIQFASYFLSNAAVLLRQPDAKPVSGEAHGAD